MYIHKLTEIIFHKIQFTVCGIYYLSKVGVRCYYYGVIIIYIACRMLQMALGRFKVMGAVSKLSRAVQTRTLTSAMAGSNFFFRQVFF